MKLYSKEGQCMVDVKSVKMDGTSIAMKCKLMGAYSMTIFLSPEELRSALNLIDWNLVSGLPGALVAGTKNEDKIRQIGSNLSAIASKNTDILLGEKTKARFNEALGEMGAASGAELFNTVMLILQVLLANKEN